MVSLKTQIIVLLFFIVPVALANRSDNRSSDDNRIYHLYNDVDMIATKKILYDKPRIVVHAVYPQLQVIEESESVNAFNLKVDDLIKEEIERFKKKVQETAEPFNATTNKKTKHDLYIDYDTSFLNGKKKHLASIRFTFQGIINGGTEAYRYHRALNYDLFENQEINLADLFQPDADYLAVLSAYTYDRLRSRLDNHEMLAYGTAPHAENFQVWNMKANGILITLDKHQIAADSQGSQTILIPFTAIKGMLLKNSPLTRCIFKKNCSHDQVLTGGFIDEASNIHPVKLLDRFLNPLFRFS